MKNSVNKTKKLSLLLSTVLAGAALLSGGDAHSDSLAARADGTQQLYGDIPVDQIETVSSGDRIKAAAASGSMMAIWETLEHGERVECLDCIPAVEPLLPLSMLSASAWSLPHEREVSRSRMFDWWSSRRRRSAPLSLGLART